MKLFKKRSLWVLLLLGAISFSNNAMRPEIHENSLSVADPVVRPKFNFEQFKEPFHRAYNYLKRIAGLKVPGVDVKGTDNPVVIEQESPVVAAQNSTTGAVLIAAIRDSLRKQFGFYRNMDASEKIKMTGINELRQQQEKKIETQIATAVQEVFGKPYPFETEQVVEAVLLSDAEVLSIYRDTREFPAKIREVAREVKTILSRLKKESIEQIKSALEDKIQELLNKYPRDKKTGFVSEPEKISEKDLKAYGVLEIELAVCRELQKNPDMIDRVRGEIADTTQELSSLLEVHKSTKPSSKLTMVDLLAEANADEEEDDHFDSPVGNHIQETSFLTPSPLPIKSELQAVPKLKSEDKKSTKEMEWDDEGSYAQNKPEDLAWDDEFGDTLLKKPIERNSSEA